MALQRTAPVAAQLKASYATARQTVSARSPVPPYADGRRIFLRPLCLSLSGIGKFYAGEEFFGVVPHTVYLVFQMEVVAGGGAGGAYQTDDLALADRIPLLYGAAARCIWA